MPKSANFRLHSLSTFLLTILVIESAVQSHCSPPPEDPADKISQLLQQLTSAPPDTCEPPGAAKPDPDQIERSILEEVSNLVLQQLNLGGSEPAAASENATEALGKIKTQSGGINATWPEENRFHYELL